MTIGSNLKKLRTARGLTQDQLAEVLHVTRQAVSGWERGRTHPDLDQLEAIAAALGVEVTTLLYGPPKSYRPSRKRVGVTVGLVALALGLGIASYWIGPWARGITSVQLTLHGYYYASYYLPLIAFTSGMAVLALANLRWKLSLSRRGGWVCLGIGLVLFLLLLFIPLSFLWAGSLYGEIPVWQGKLAGFLFLITYKQWITLAAALVSGALCYTGGQTLLAERPGGQ